MPDAPNRLTIRRPDDWHLHLRDGAMLEGVIGDTSRHFARAIIMPNLVPPVVTTDDARAYRDRILKAVPAGDRFEPLMTLYLTEHTNPDDVEEGKRSGLITAVKLYPAGATTNSHGGVRDMEKAMPVLERMAKIGLPLCVHGEVTTPEVDIFDREKVFIDTVLDPLRHRLPELKITMEHVTTQEGIDYIDGATSNLAGSITTPSPDHQPQRTFSWAASSRITIACRSPSANITGWRLRRAATSGEAVLLPRHRFGAACRPAQGMRLRLRRHLHVDQHDELPCPCFRAGECARKARGLHLAERPRLVWPRCE